MTRLEEQKQYTPDTFKVLLKKLTQAPDDFTADDVAQCFRHLCKVDGIGATEAQVSLVSSTPSASEINF